MSKERINLDLNNTEGVTCEECGNDTFLQVFIIRKISALMSPTGQETIAPIPATFQCSKCGHINKEFDIKKGPDEDKAKITQK